jgi:undecaprenyl-phosphate 4-deoxy-4-formamido-L-arabinose transferase
MSSRIYFQPELSVVVPVYCSENILPELAFRMVGVMAEREIGYEVILSDDHSADRSWQVIQTIVKQYPHFKGIRSALNAGLAYNALKGMACARGKYIVTIDDDLEYDPADILKLYDHLLETGADVVFGLAPEKYQLQGKSPTRAHWRNKVLNFLWNKPVTDSFKILRREVVFDQDIFQPKIPFEAFLKQNRRSIRVGYKAVSYQKRFAGISNYTWRKKLQLFWQMSVAFWWRK